MGLEIYSPQFMFVQCRFLYSFFGRGISYIFLGSIVLSSSVGGRLICGVMPIAVGVLYVIFQFVPLKPPPHGGIMSKKSSAKSSNDEIGLESGPVKWYIITYSIDSRQTKLQIQWIVEGLRWIMECQYFQPSSTNVVAAPSSIALDNGITGSLLSPKYRSHQRFGTQDAMQSQRKQIGMGACWSIWMPALS